MWNCNCHAQNKDAKRFQERWEKFTVKVEASPAQIYICIINDKTTLCANKKKRATNVKNHAPILNK